MFYNERAVPSKGAIMVSHLNCFVNSFIQDNHWDVCHTFFFFSLFTVWFGFNLLKLKKKDSFLSLREHLLLHWLIHRRCRHTQKHGVVTGDVRGRTLTWTGRSAFRAVLPCSNASQFFRKHPAPLLLSGVLLLTHIHYHSNTPVSHHLSLHRRIWGL